MQDLAANLKAMEALSAEQASCAARALLLFEGIGDLEHLEATAHCHVDHIKLMRLSLQLSHEQSDGSKQAAHMDEVIAHHTRDIYTKAARCRKHGRVLACSNTPLLLLSLSTAAALPCCRHVMLPFGSCMRTPPGVHSCKLTYLSFEVHSPLVLRHVHHSCRSGVLSRGCKALPWRAMAGCCIAMHEMHLSLGALDIMFALPTDTDRQGACRRSSTACDCRLRLGSTTLFAYCLASTSPKRGVLCGRVQAV